MEEFTEGPNRYVRNVLVLKKDTCSVRELIIWVNKQLQCEIKELSELTAGDIYCQIMHKVAPKAMPMDRVFLNTNVSHEIESNYNMFRNALEKLNIHKNIYHRDLAKGIGHYEFVTWLHKFHRVNCKSDSYDAVAERKGQPIGLKKILNTKPTVNYTAYLRRSTTIVSQNGGKGEVAHRSNSLVGMDDKNSDGTEDNADPDQLKAKPNKKPTQKRSASRPAVRKPAVPGGARPPGRPKLERSLTVIHPKPWQQAGKATQQIKETAQAKSDQARANPKPPTRANTALADVSKPASPGGKRLERSLTVIHPKPWQQAGKATQQKELSQLKMDRALPKPKQSRTLLSQKKWEPAQKKSETFLKKVGTVQKKMKSGQNNSQPNEPKWEPADSELAESEPAEQEPAEQEPAEAVPAEAEPAKAESPEAEPAKPESAEPESKLPKTEQETAKVNPEPPVQVEPEPIDVKGDIIKIELPSLQLRRDPTLLRMEPVKGTPDPLGMTPAKRIYFKRIQRKENASPAASTRKPTQRRLNFKRIMGAAEELVSEKVLAACEPIRLLGNVTSLKSPEHSNLSSIVEAAGPPAEPSTSQALTQQTESDSVSLPQNVKNNTSELVANEPIAPNTESSGVPPDGPPATASLPRKPFTNLKARGMIQAQKKKHAPLKVRFGSVEILAYNADASVYANYTPNVAIAKQVIQSFSEQGAARSSAPLASKATKKPAATKPKPIKTSSVVPNLFLQHNLPKSGSLLSLPVNEAAGRLGKKPKLGRPLATSSPVITDLDECRLAELPPDSDSDDDDDDRVWNTRRQIALLKDKLTTVECILMKYCGESGVVMKKLKRYFRKQEVDEPFIMGTF
ncbi:PREDICTED: proteoglycan 4-like [Drosophila arizonae]|uniref:Proteoglycan 4-like n=1 Tax=Drosophila arizonae TaxID=7263 RepID=A0ABM1PZK5_DROAR|nr:PREDICTED: proteoglycan 4-like [Drosophila arizonae]XP_017872641.1 PREDICTED: proteoglycan 4-like [Drosophila arizonae]XP_017872642.1 PREDICTED: proteoglycan 4-like [Drosophila arizonae]XP_017872643.1 PREDICTED: proteoglycan 4-like [Drosophila arizonae]